MSRVLALVLVLFLGVLYAPISAQAIVSPYLPTFILKTIEPLKLLVAGAVLISLARIGRHR
jgi:hypothetical protein